MFAKKCFCVFLCSHLSQESQEYMNCLINWLYMCAKKQFWWCVVLTFITRIFELLHKLIVYVCKEEIFVLCGIHIYHIHIRCVGTLIMGVSYPLYLIYPIKSYSIFLSYPILFYLIAYIYIYLNLFSSYPITHLYIHKVYNISFLMFVLKFSWHRLGKIFISFSD